MIKSNIIFGKDSKDINELRKSSVDYQSNCKTRAKSKESLFERNHALLLYMSLLFFMYDSGVDKGEESSKSDLDGDCEGELLDGDCEGEVLVRDLYYDEEKMKWEVKEDSNKGGIRKKEELTKSFRCELQKSPKLDTNCSKIHKKLSCFCTPKEQRTPIKEDRNVNRKERQEVKQNKVSCFVQKTQLPKMINIFYGKKSITLFEFLLEEFFIMNIGRELSDRRTDWMLRLFLQQGYLEILSPALPNETFELDSHLKSSKNIDFDSNSIFYPSLYYFATFKYITFLAELRSFNYAQIFLQIQFFHELSSQKCLYCQHIKHKF